MSEPTQKSRGIDRRHFVAGGVAAAAANVIAPGNAVAHHDEDGGISEVVCATVEEHVSVRSMDALALPTGRRFRVELEPHPWLANGDGSARQLSDFPEGQSVVVLLPAPAEVDAATVGESGPVRAKGVVQLVVGTRRDIRGRTHD